MLRNAYLALGGLLIGGYLTWSALGWETGGTRREPVPTVRAARAAAASSGYVGRSRSGYYGSGFSFGK